jgi:hypothetical protein
MPGYGTTNLDSGISRAIRNGWQLHGLSLYSKLVDDKDGGQLRPESDHDRSQLKAESDQMGKQLKQGIRTNGDPGQSG